MTTGLEEPSTKQASPLLLCVRVGRGQSCRAQRCELLLRRLHLLCSPSPLHEVWAHTLPLEHTQPALPHTPSPSSCPVSAPKHKHPRCLHQPCSLGSCPQHRSPSSAACALTSPARHTRLIYTRLCVWEGHRLLLVVFHTHTLCPTAHS